MKSKNNESYTEEVNIPDGVEVSVDNNLINVKGKIGQISRLFRNPQVTLSTKDRKIAFSVKKYTKKEKKMLNTIKSHVKNMLYGVNDVYTYKLKICSGHFPMNVSVSDGKFIIKNFVGEKYPRILELDRDVKVTVNGEEIIVEGVDREKVGLTSGRIEKLTRRPHYDKRVFQQGIFITEKGRRLGW